MLILQRLFSQFGSLQPLCGITAKGSCTDDAVFENALPGRSRGINFIGSTHIKVRHNRRIHNHKVFDLVAQRRQCSLGWFYGFKLHLIINDKGEMLSFTLQKAMLTTGT